MSWICHEHGMDMSWKCHLYVMNTSWTCHDNGINTSGPQHYYIILTSCSHQFHVMFTTCSRHVHDMFTSWSWHDHDMIMTCSWHIFYFSDYWPFKCIHTTEIFRRVSWPLYCHGAYGCEFMSGDQHGSRSWTNVILVVPNALWNKASTLGRNYP